MADADTLRLVPFANEAPVFVTSGSKSSARTQAWELDTGTVLWQRPDRERGMAAIEAANGVLYADVSGHMGTDRADADETVVVDARTKEVIATPGPAGRLVPETTANGYGYGYVSVVDDGAWVFPPSPRT